MAGWSHARLTATMPRLALTTVAMAPSTVTSARELAGGSPWLMAITVCTATAPTMALRKAAASSGSQAPAPMSLGWVVSRAWKTSSASTAARANWARLKHSLVGR